MQEDINHLIKWIDEIQEIINDLNTKKDSSDILVFMIVNTSQDTGDGRPYLTPIRELSNGFVFGSIVYSQTQAILLSTKIDGLVDYIFVDSVSNETIEVSCPSIVSKSIWDECNKKQEEILKRKGQLWYFQWVIMFVTTNLI